MHDVDGIGIGLYLAREIVTLQGGYIRVASEVEYPTVDAARSWKPEAFGLADYLNDDVTDQPGQSMGAYWEQTRK